MEGAKVRKQGSLCVERNFEGCRLERQLVVSAYEWAVPTVSASGNRVAEVPREDCHRDKALSFAFAKGA
jgi:hypothetical protein